MRFCKRHTAVYLIRIGVCVTAAYAPLAFGSTMGLDAPSSYTIELSITTMSAGRITHGAETIARRSDGARVEIDRAESAVDPSHWTTRRTILFEDGSSVDIGEDGKIIADPKRHQSASRSPYTIDPASDCRKEFDRKSWSSGPLVMEGHDSIRGFDAVRMRVTGQNGEIVTLWRSPVFACEIVQQDTVMRNGTIEHQIPVSLDLGEPDSALFQMPSDYKQPGSAASPSVHANTRKGPALSSSLLP